MTNEHASSTPNRVRRFFSLLGPGLITGAADDDPSGVVTYSIAGAQMGTAMLWTAFGTWPFMACVQFMYARIGMVTGMGLGYSLRRKGPRWLLFGGALGLLAANTINIGSDLSAMADSAEMLTGINSHIYVVILGIGMGYATIRFRYHQIAMVMKWLAAVLLAYVINVFIIHPDWSSVLHDTFIPSWPSDHNAWQNLVAILGTTISPYLFFWQTSQEVEEQKAMGRRLLREQQSATRKEISGRKIDVGFGTFFSNFVMYFIILTTALVLHSHGITDIATSRDVAEALRPLAGTLAYLLYTVGIIGVGFLAIPTLAGSAAYAFAETFSWKEGLDEPFRGAIPFYTVLIFSMLLGVGLDFFNINPVKALYWTAIVNGVLAPFLLVGILIVASDRKLMQAQPSSWVSLAAVAVITIVMFGAAAAMFVL
jgi:NRAMP (natural resistance-associated macrophage protein)-like metal ion transporter